MKKEVFDLTEISNFRDTKNHGFLRVIKKELKYVGILFLLVLITFKIAFYKENLVVLFRNVLSLFWLFVLPGYFIMLHWKEKIGFLERFVVGIALSAAIIGIFSYYLGIMGLNIRYHTIILPLVLILIGIIINLKES